MLNGLHKEDGLNYFILFFSQRIYVCHWPCASQAIDLCAAVTVDEISQIFSKNREKWVILVPGRDYRVSDKKKLSNFT